MKDLLLEKFKNSMLIQKETSQVLGGRKLESETYCVFYLLGQTSDTIDRDYDDGSTTSSTQTDCES